MASDSLVSAWGLDTHLDLKFRAIWGKLIVRINICTSDKMWVTRLASPPSGLSCLGWGYFYWVSSASGAQPWTC